MTRQRSPLEPAATWVHVFLVLAGFLVVVTGTAAVLGSGSLFGIGASEVCVEAANGRVPVPQDDVDVVLGVEDGVRSWTPVVELCVTSPTAGQRALGVLAQAPAFLVFVGALVLATRLIRGASREGIFTVRVAGRLRTLGWVVLAGEAAATFVEAQARNWLIDAMMEDRRGVLTLDDWDVPIMALFFGAVLISVARIMRVSTTMREELEGTV